MIQAVCSSDATAVCRAGLTHLSVPCTRKVLSLDRRPLMVTTFLLGAGTCPDDGGQQQYLPFVSDLVGLIPKGSWEEAKAWLWV